VRRLIDRLASAGGPPAEASAATSARRIYILPTRSGVGYALVLLATLIGALNYQNNLALFLSFLMISASLVSMHQCWFALLGLRLEARDGVPVFPGQTARFPLVITDDKGQARYGLCIEDTPTPPPAAPVLAAKGHLDVDVGRVAERRGRLALGAVTLATRYPFGLFRAWTRVPLRAAVDVYPKPAARAPAPPALPAFVHHGSGDMGTGADDFVGLRPYREGDSPRQLDWKALARERGLVVKQFGGDQAARVWIDWDHTSGSDESRLGIMARQVLDAEEQNLTFGLRLPGVEIEHGRGDGHKHRCLSAMARYRIDG
jgi:uncharacterized protein (DUF58 family)